MHYKYCVHGACSVAASYKPPMLVTQARLPACAFFRLLKGGCCNSLESCLHTVSCCLMLFSRFQAEPTCSPKRDSGVRLTPPPTGAHSSDQAVLYREVPATSTRNILVPSNVRVILNQDRLPGHCYRRGVVILMVEADCNSIVGLGCNIRIQSV